MAIKGNIYIVTMYRWADTDCHSYILGVFDKKKAAIDAGEAEREYRGGTKYYPQCLEFTGFGKQRKDAKVIVELPIHPFMKKRN